MCDSLADREKVTAAAPDSPRTAICPTGQQSYVHSPQSFMTEYTPSLNTSGGGGGAGVGGGSGAVKLTSAHGHTANIGLERTEASAWWPRHAHHLGGRKTGLRQTSVLGPRSI